MKNENGCNYQVLDVLYDVSTQQDYTVNSGGERIKFVNNDHEPTNPDDCTNPNVETPYMTSQNLINGTNLII